VGAFEPICSIKQETDDDPDPAGPPQQLQQLSSSTLYASDSYENSTDAFLENLQVTSSGKFLFSFFFYYLI
jgi:hypothetical protein